ncbi:MAG: hypothetical protein S4CHLAM123_02940 [Chlamydiales bacterium]|nr:hypothetical protein [Chlamydiales bacterium]
MQQTAMLKALLSKSERQEELLNYLPEELVHQLQRCPSPNLSAAEELRDFTLWGNHVHYSWFYEFLRPLSTQVQLLFLSSLTQTQARGLTEMLSVAAPHAPTSRFVQLFLKDHLKKQLQDSEILSIEQLPLSTCNSLLTLHRKQLIHIIDLLGIHDLAAEMRQVVDKKLLASTAKALTAEQRYFLNYCSKQPMKWIPPKLGLLSWDGTAKSLNRLLHKRGLIRLARGVFDESASYKWHLLHKLDTGRAKIIQKEFYQKQDLTLLPFFKNQILYLSKKYTFKEALS